MDTMLLIFWGIIFGLCVIAELATMQLITIWFAVGALAAFVMTLLEFGFLSQLAVFVLTSTILLVATRPLLKKLRVKDVIPSNAEQEIGKKAVVIEEIDMRHGTGRVRLNGVDWIALAEDSELVIPVDNIVIIRGVDGAKLIVVPE